MVRTAWWPGTKVPSGRPPGSDRLTGHNLHQHARDPRAPDTNRRPTLSPKQPIPQTPRKERRAAERRDRFEVARDERRSRPGGSRSGGGPSTILNTRNMTIAGVLVGVLIVAFVAIGQLGLGGTGTIRDPGIAYPASLEDHTALGKTTAPVTLEIYGDFQCPVCANSALNVEPLVVDKYVKTGLVRLVHHDIAILGGAMTADNESRIAASGAVCADQQGKYWDYAHWVFDNQRGENAGGFKRDRITSIAKAAGLDTTAFTTCLDAADTLATVDANAKTALGMGIDSTPTMYINGVSIGAGLKSIDQLSQLIDAALVKASSSPSPSGSPATSASPAASASTTP